MPIEIRKLRRVTIIPILKNSQNFIFTFCFSADSITIRLAIAPIIVALPANVDAEARDSHNISLEIGFKTGSIITVYGTLLTI